jgi:hypothetical protein
LCAFTIRAARRFVNRGARVRRVPFLTRLFPLFSKIILTIAVNTVKFSDFLKKQFTFCRTGTMMEAAEMRSAFSYG